MGLYIRPAEKVEQDGRRITLGDSMREMQSQLQKGERAVAVAVHGFGKVALLIQHEDDFREVHRAGCDGLYAVNEELAATAS